MHLIMKKILNFSVIAALFLGFLSCETMEDPEIKNTSTWPLNGKYWVQYDSTSNGNTYIGGYHKLIVTNTSSDNGDSILINDNGTGFALKAAVNMNDLTFNVENYQVNDTTTISLNSGKLLDDATKTPGEGVVTDSLYFEMEIDWPNTTDQVTISGYKYTGWPADNH